MQWKRRGGKTAGGKGHEQSRCVHDSLVLLEVCAGQLRFMYIAGQTFGKRTRTRKSTDALAHQGRLEHLGRLKWLGRALSPIQGIVAFGWTGTSIGSEGIGVASLR